MDNTNSPIRSTIMLYFRIIIFGLLLTPINVVLADETAALAEVDAWVNQLSADRFAERELAAQKLVDAGVIAIEPVVRGIEGDEPETVSRGLHVLRQLGLSDEEATEDAARRALERLAASEKTRASARAKNTLAYLNESRQDRAVAKIRALGGTVNESSSNQFVGVWQTVTTFDVTIDEQWRGGTKGLRYVRWLPDLRKVTFDGKHVDDSWLASIEGLETISSVEINRTSVTDEGVKKVGALPALSQLSVKYSPVTDAVIKPLGEIKKASIITLYGTKITPAGAEKLRKATAETDAQIDYRRGGFLGVGCTQTDAGCTVSQVHTDSAAHKAGIRVGDIITEYAGQPVPDFQALTVLVSENVAGATVQIKLRRQGKDETTKDLTLGEWD